MDDILEQILDELKELRQGQQAQGQELKSVNQRLGNLEEGQTNLRQGQQAQGQELKSVNQRLGNLEEGQINLRQGQEKIGKDLTNLAVHVEDELTEQIKALYDARGVILDSLDRIETQQDRQNSRLEAHWREILVLKTERR